MAGLDGADLNLLKALIVEMIEHPPDRAFLSEAMNLDFVEQADYDAMVADLTKSLAERLREIQSLEG